MLNLIITSQEDFWKKSPVFFQKDRSLTEYILPEFKERYGDFSSISIQDIVNFPCVFAYEKPLKQDALIGRITNIQVQQTNIRLDYSLTEERICYDDLSQLTNLLDMGTWEWNRTHWTIKKANLEDLKPYFSSKKKNNPTVFISYSWNPPENQKNVFSLIEKLEKDSIHVIYDKKDLHPGQDMNYFMEQALSLREVDAVIIVCNSDYAQKANSRSGGVGYESGLILNQIRNEPLQDRYIPVASEQTDKGELPLPDFLKSRNCIDLTAENGYDCLKKAIYDVAGRDDKL